MFEQKIKPQRQGSTVKLFSKLLFNEN